MHVAGRHYRSVWAEPVRDAGPAGRLRLVEVHLVNQPLLPHRFEILTLRSHAETAEAIRTMIVRGAPALGAAAAYGLAQAAAAAPLDGRRERFLAEAEALLRSTRPTAHDLFYTLDAVAEAIAAAPPPAQAEAALAAADRLADESAERCRRIGEHGLALMEPERPVLTHCNAGWLACVDWGTALAPIYLARRAGRAPLVYVDETRPRLQGANLTAWELEQEGIAYRLIADNAAGWLIRRGEIGMILTGADRVAANGDVANKIGTYEKALLAREHGIPFYVAAPASTFDLNCPHGDAIPIEERPAEEVLRVQGLDDAGRLLSVRLAPAAAQALNPAFDVTPAELVTGLITEHGLIEASAEAIARTLGAPAR